MLRNIARMTTATTGTGTITLGSAVSSFLTFALAGVQNAETVTYAIEDGANREIGRGVYTSSGTTLTRTVLKSTNSDTAISLSGSAVVFLTAAAEDIVTKSANGSVVVGLAGTSGFVDLVQLQGTGFNPAIGVRASRYADDAFGTYFTGAKSRGATVGDQAVVQSGDALFTFRASGGDGTNMVDAGYIVFEVDGTPGTDDMPGRITFSTT